MIQYCLLVILLSIVSACTGELVLYFMVYSKETYKAIAGQLEKVAAGVDKRIDTIAEVQVASRKRLEREQERLKTLNKEMSVLKMKSMLFVGLIFTGMMGVFNRYFDGIIVAKLPFIPVSMIQGVSHRNIDNDDFTDCSFIFLYILCTMCIRTNIQKMLGYQPSRTVTKLTQAASVFDGQR
uniref:Calcium load-activated calcium channel n=1 Tax=Rhabditophanes sp. KR3021 TaxID=114890 RepID=A0AC35U055_9BILA